MKLTIQNLTPEFLIQRAHNTGFCNIENKTLKILIYKIETLVNQIVIQKKIAT